MGCQPKLIQTPNLAYYNYKFLIINSTNNLWNFDQNILKKFNKSP